ncbi:MAG TPA: hypothetical protein VGB06_00715 [Solirubrobacterales bacterium]
MVISIEDADLLSTVALALAVLAFSAQLVVFVGQERSASEQARRNEELHGRMQGVLAEIREKAAGTQADVKTISEKMLEAILAKYLPDAAEGQLNPQRLAAEISSAVSQVQRDDESQFAQDTLFPPRRPTPNDQRYREVLRSFPNEEEVGDAMTILTSLPQRDRIMLKRFGEDEILALRPDSPYDPSWVDLTQSLTAEGLVAPYPPEYQALGGLRVSRLTDKGRSVARLLTATGEPPPHLEGLRAIRENMPERLEW